MEMMQIARTEMEFGETEIDKTDRMEVEEVELDGMEVEVR